MALKCKAGDLALVVHDEADCHANIGRIVRVRGPVEFNRYYQKPCWLIKPIKRVMWSVSDTGSPVVRMRVNWSHRSEHPDEWLLPIRPDASDLDSVEAIVQSLIKDLTPRSHPTQPLVLPFAAPSVVPAEV